MERNTTEKRNIELIQRIIQRDTEKKRKNLNKMHALKENNPFFQNSTK